MMLSSIFFLKALLEEGVSVILFLQAVSRVCQFYLSTNLSQLRFIDFLILKLIITNRPMLSDHQPQKENRSPERRKKQKNQKQIKSIEQIFTTLTSYGLNVSAYLENQLLCKTGNQVKLFEEKDQNSSLQNRKLRVKLNDYEFQIKKVNEDFAQYTLLAKMDKEKAVKRLREELEQEKYKNLEENKKWLKNFQERQKKYELQCANFKTSTEYKQRTEKETEILSLKQDYSSRLSALIKQKEELLLQNTNKIQQLHQTYNNALKIKDQTYLRRIQELQLQIKNTAELYDSKYQEKVVIIQLEKKEQIKLITEVQKQTEKTKDAFLYQIGKTQREKLELSERYDKLEMSFKILTKRFEDKKMQIEQLKKQFQSQLQSLAQSKQKSQNKIKKDFSQQKMQILKSQYAKMQKMQQKLLKMQQVKQNTTQTYKSLLRSIEMKFDKRQSKRQDIQVIKVFQDRLHCKQRENHHIYEQLKLIRLQKDNNQKIYTKIFTANKDRRSGSNKQKDINALLKTANTSDLRYLLKISHK